MKEFIKAMDEAPLWLKIVLALPAIDIIWVVYRVLKSAVKQNMVGLVVAAILIIVGIPFVWLIDIICLLVMGKVWWID